MCRGTTGAVRRRLAREHLDLSEIVASYKSGLVTAIRSAPDDGPAALCLLLWSLFLAEDREGLRRAVIP